MDYKELILHWLSLHKTSTLPAWLKRNPLINEWVIENTKQYSPKNIMESVYIALNGPPQYCKYGNKLQFNTYDLGYRVGCIKGNKCKCVNDLRVLNHKNTLIKKYGVDTTGQIPGISERRKNTMLERYGVAYAMQSDDILQKRKLADINKTVEEWDNTNKKRKNSYLKKYGVSHHMQLESQQKKVKDTNMLRYGVEFPLQNTEISKKMSKTQTGKSLEQKNNIVTKTKNTLNDRYNVSAASRIDMSQATLEILDNADAFKSTITNLTRLEAVQHLGIAKHTLYLYAKKYQAFDLFARPATSKFELDVRQFVESLDITALYNNRTIIPPCELDIFIPEKNIAIECCGLYWHSENSAGRTQGYHSNKYEKCLLSGITLITIFDDEWYSKQELIKSRLLHILKKLSSSKIYARTCKIIEPMASEIDTFINSHHLQGSVASKIKLALTYDNKIIAAMTIGIPRYNKKYQYEILRFCTTGQVVGAASKLFSYFVRKWKPTSVISYSDNRWGNGAVYTAMGFKKISSTIGYFYTDYKNRFNRSQFQKHKLIKDGADDLQTEWEIMQSRGYDRIWDCGQSLWVYTNSVDK